MNILVFLIVIAVSVRCIMYGIWTFKEKNLLGASFISILSLGTVAFAAYLMFRPGA